MTEKFKLIPGKLYKPSSYWYLHKKRGYPVLFYVERQHNETEAVVEHFFLDANGEKITIRATPEEEDFSHLFKRIR